MRSPTSAARDHVRRLLLYATGHALAPRRRAFRRAVDRCRATQDAVLRDIVRRTSRSGYGRAHGVDARDDYAAFAAKLPIVTYDELLPWIDSSQLVDDRVLRYERTSGSTAATKRIPYTAALRRSFHRMFLVWLEDILRHGPPLQRGTLYIPTASDLEFLDRRFASLLRRFLVPLSANPEVVSVWNASVLHGLAPMPGVKLVSCWAAGSESLRETFPNAVIQHKGLLSTEAPVTIPLFDAPGFVPVLDEVFFEFEDDRGRVHRLDELCAGGEYALIVSQKGGLVRYRLGDRVRVSHVWRDVPCLDFLGREGVSDLAGEKLSEGLAREVLSLAAGNRFAVLLPERNGYLVVADRGDADVLAGTVEAQLLRSYRYAEARGLGQLLPVRAAIASDAPARWLDYFEFKGMRRGDIKPAALVRDRADASALAGIFDASTVQ